MKFIKEINEQVAVVTLDEKKLDTSNSGLLKGEFTQFIKGERVTKLVVDLSSIEQCDSSGLSALLVANRLMEETGGSMILIPSEKIFHLCEITKLDRILRFTSSREEAVKHLSGTRG